MRRKITPFQTWAESRLLPLICLLGLMLAAQPSQAAAAVPPDSDADRDARVVDAGVVQRFSTDSGPAVLRKAAAGAIEDVVIGPDGRIRGRVIAGPTTNGPRQLRVKFVLGQRTVAVTATDPEGRFEARNLSGGLYRVVAEGPDGSNWRFCRLWPATTAPPCARALATLPAAKPLVRGQRPLTFPIMSLKQAAALTGIAAGAIAVPLIYHNARVQNQVPVSP